VVAWSSTAVTTGFVRGHRAPVTTNNRRAHRDTRHRCTRMCKRSNLPPAFQVQSSLDQASSELQQQYRDFRPRCQVRHEVHVADGRAKSTAERLEIFACAGVTASEYEVLLPGGMRREEGALGTWSRQHPRLLPGYQERIDLVQRSRRNLARTRLRANRTAAATNTAVRTAEPVAPHSAWLHPPASVAAWNDRD
jgi:hypothetical protein